MTALFSPSPSTLTCPATTRRWAGTQTLLHPQSLQRRVAARHEQRRGYVEQLRAAGELWRLAVYEGTFDSNGDDLDRPAFPTCGTG